MQILLFLFAGVDPDTAWMAECGIELDKRGFVKVWKSSNSGFAEDNDKEFLLLYINSRLWKKSKESTNRKCLIVYTTPVCSTKRDVLRTVAFVVETTHPFVSCIRMKSNRNMDQQYFGH